MRRKNSELNTSQEDIKSDKNFVPNFGVSFEKEPHTPDANPWRQNQLTNTLEQKENTEKKFKVSICSFFLLVTCFFLSSKLSFLSPGDYLQIVVVYKPLCSELRRSFLCSLTFLMVGLQQGPTTTIDVVIQPLTCLSMRWYKYLFSTIIPQ